MGQHGNISCFDSHIYRIEMVGFIPGTTGVRRDSSFGVEGKEYKHWINQASWVDRLVQCFFVPVARFGTPAGRKGGNSKEGEDGELCAAPYSGAILAIFE